jgi:hypothetical protein
VPFVRALARNGFQVVFLHPMTKLPIDGRTPAQRKEDDKNAQEAAKAVGDPRYAEVRTHEGIEIATSDEKRLVSMVKKIMKDVGQPPNIAIVPDGTFVVVDADQADSVERFREAYKYATGKDIHPTVSSPGVFGDGGPDGEWKHKHGGHFYLTLPDGYALPEFSREITIGKGSDAWTIFPRDHYVLVPPSTRPEGHYVWNGDVREAPMALLEAFELDSARIAEARARREERAQLRASGVLTQGGIDAWAEETDWRTLLVPDGWYFTGSRTSCGCPEVTAPGVHASPKSATAHEVGCRETDTSMGHGPLHIWTDNPPEGVAAYVDQQKSKTMTKLQYAAWMHHDGDEGAAIRALGILSGGHLMGGPASDAFTEDALRESGCLPPVDDAPAPPVAEAPEQVPTALTAPVTALPAPVVDIPAPVSGIPAPYVYTGPVPEEWAKRAFDPNDRTLYPQGFPADPALMEAVFNHCDRCRAVFHHARNRRPKNAPPFAVLFRTLLRCGTRVPVSMRLWDNAPLSTYVAAVGRSGTGKSVAAMEDSAPWAELPAPLYSRAASTRVIERKDKAKSGDKEPAGDGIATPGDGVSPILIEHDFDKATMLGSGQVLADKMTVKVKIEEETITEMAPWPVVLIDYDELLDLLAVAKREASTIVSTFNAAWAGRPIGNSTRSNGETETTGPYTVMKWGGLQPKLGGDLLRLSGPGYLQRFAFTSITDPYRHAGLPVIPQAGPVPLQLLPEVDAESRFEIDPGVLVEIEASNVDGDFDHLPDPADEERSHHTQVRVRIALLGALFHGGTKLTRDLWEWAGLLMEHSDRTLAWMRAEVTKAELVNDTEEGARRARVTAATESSADDMLESTIALVHRHIEDAGAAGITARDMRRKLAAGKKPFLNKALAALIKGNHTTYTEGRYRIKVVAAGGSIATPTG